jgi:hypothetical protein
MYSLASISPAAASLLLLPGFIYQIALLQGVEERQ